MDPGDFVNSSETRLAVSRIITWTTEPKSSDVRKVRACQTVSVFFGSVFLRSFFHISRKAVLVVFLIWFELLVLGCTVCIDFPF